MIKAIIIDDEKDARFLLKDLIENKLNDKLELLGEADDVDSGITLIRETNPDLVFLDIQMKTGTGFDLLAKIGDLDFEVIFVSAYDQFAIDAFKFSAFGYLLKPLKLSELKEAVEKLEERFLKTKESLNKQVKILIENYGHRGEIQKIIIPNVQGFQILEISAILRLEGDRNYTHFIDTSGNKITSSKSLGEYEEMMIEHGFYRIHQSTIVSLRHIKAFRKTDDGYVELIDGTVHKVSRNRKQGLLSKFT